MLRTTCATLTLICLGFGANNLCCPAADAKPAEPQPRQKSNLKGPLPRLTPLPMTQPPPAAPVQPQPAIPFQKIEAGPKSSVKLFRTIVINDKKTWERLLQNHKPHGSDFGNPVLDFEKETVIAVFAGQKSYAGYSVQIVGINRTNLGAKVIYKIVAPTAGDGTAQAVNQPYMLVKTQKITGPISFVPDPSMSRANAPRVPRSETTRSADSSSRPVYSTNVESSNSRGVAGSPAPVKTAPPAKRTKTKED